MQSVADTCIIPMQDWLGLDNCARINKPSTLGGNWCWKMTTNQQNDALMAKIAPYHSYIRPHQRFRR